MAERALSGVQYGKETTRGTAVSATRPLYCDPLKIVNDRKVAFPETPRRVRSKSQRSVIYNRLVKDSIKLSNAYFQALPMAFGCGLKGGVTATEQTASQGDYLWTFTPSFIAANAPDSLTIENGDDQQAYRVEYAMFERIKLGGVITQDGGGPVTMDLDFFGRQWTKNSFTSSPTAVAAVDMNSKLTRMYLDTAWGSVGGTEKTNVLRAWEVDILTGIHPKFYGGQNKYFDVHGEEKIEIMATLTLEGNSIADAIRDAQLASTFQILRLMNSGPQIGSGLNHSLTLDIGGYWEEVVPLDSEENGDNLHKALFHAVIEESTNKKLQVAVSTSVNTY